MSSVVDSLKEIGVVDNVVVMD